MVKQDLKNLSIEQLIQWNICQGYPRYYAQQIFSWIYKRQVGTFSKMTNLSKEARGKLEEDFYFSTLEIVKQQVSKDGTEKFLFKLEDANLIETVYIPEKGRGTLCVSSQVGCKFKCAFCVSGEQGFKRNLTVSEIINQYLCAAKELKNKKITNIVFMGVGEPLDNYDNLIAAVKVFLNPNGMYFGKRKICVSTCGLVPEIKELSRLNLGIKLSVSLHSAEDGTRSELMPINKKYPLKLLIGTLREFSRHEKYPVTFEYTLIKGINTSVNSARSLSRLVRGFNYKINLIALNYSCDNFFPPDSSVIEKFTQELLRQKVFFTFRRARGTDISAACGQLKAQF